MLVRFGLKPVHLKNAITALSELRIAIENDVTVWSGFQECLT
jgi:hypothetical protein